MKLSYLNRADWFLYNDELYIVGSEKKYYRYDESTDIQVFDVLNGSVIFLDEDTEVEKFQFGLISKLMSKLF